MRFRFRCAAAEWRHGAPRDAPVMHGRRFLCQQRVRAASAELARTSASHTGGRGSESRRSRLGHPAPRSLLCELVGGLEAREERRSRLNCHDGAAVLPDLFEQARQQLAALGWRRLACPEAAAGGPKRSRASGPCAPGRAILTRSAAPLERSGVPPNARAASLRAPRRRRRRRRRRRASRRAARKRLPRRPAPA